MKIYFPQWQGAGIGKGIESGAKAVLDYLDNPVFQNIPLSTLAAGKDGVQAVSYTHLTLPTTPYV